MNINKLDFNLLKVFDAIFNEQKLTMAAQKLSLSQPAVSHSLAKLRDFFNDPLFVREKNAMMPTAKALLIHANIKKALSLLRQTIEDKGDTNPEKSSRSFCIGLTNYCSITVLPGLLKKIEQQAPHIRITTLHSTLQQKTQYLEDGRFDLVISCSRLKTAGLKQQRLFEDREVCIAGPQTIIPGGSFSIDQISDYPLIRLQISDNESSDIFRLLDKKKLPLRNTFTTDQELIIPQVVSTTGYIGIIAQKIAEKYQQAFDFNIYPITGIKTRFSAWQYWHLRDDKDPIHTWFRNRVKAVCAGPFEEPD